MESDNINNIIVELVERENKSIMLSLFALTLSTIAIVGLVLMFVLLR